MAYINKQMLTAVVADGDGNILELEGYAAAGMSGDDFFILTRSGTAPMPSGSELMRLPDRAPVVFNLRSDRFEILETNPFQPDQSLYPVGVFNSPGYVNRHFCAYDDRGTDTPLPLFSYGAVGFGQDSFRSAALLVDDEPRQDLRLMPIEQVKKGVETYRKKYPDNRLMRHLERCALEYGCPAGKNFFLGRYEAPLPTAVVCNARCLGCISLQTENTLCACQDRISFVPDPDEIAAVALEHILNVEQAVVSFGQGCEGEPLTSADAIEKAIVLIRKKSGRGTINLNTNASLPDRVERLCRAGLDSMRVSMNSVRKACYTAYFRPVSYCFEDVLESIRRARAHGCFVAINYLNCPGFTDCEQEKQALFDFIRETEINMIQWRNLNFDPRHYIRIMEKAAPGGPPTGMANLINTLGQTFSHLVHGYFNPPRQ